MSKDFLIFRRALTPADRESLRQLLVQIKSFDLDDQMLALELITTALEAPEQKDYDFIIAAGEEDIPVGFACYGPTPLTQGTYDLYWIAVNPAYSGQGIGTRLLRWVEEEITARKGRMLVIETSSSEKYAQAQSFYQKNGYTLTETIPDFYHVGEDRITYLKRFG